MAGSDWRKCKFLESAENLKPLVKMRFGREPSSALAHEISACLQQGRLFYEAAESSPLEIRPLQQCIDSAGTFQEFNDVVARLTRLCCIDNATENCAVILPSASTSTLHGTELSLSEILSRIPELESLYRMTFGSDPNTQAISVELSFQKDDEVRIRIDDKEPFGDRESTSP